MQTGRNCSPLRPARALKATLSPLLHVGGASQQKPLPPQPALPGAQVDRLTTFQSLVGEEDVPLDLLFCLNRPSLKEPR